MKKINSQKKIIAVFLVTFLIITLLNVISMVNKETEPALIDLTGNADQSIPKEEFVSTFPYLELENSRFETHEMASIELPDAYIYSGAITKEMSFDGEYLVGCDYFTKEGSNDFYVYTLTGAPERANNTTRLDKFDMYYLRFQKANY